ncbi:RIMS-binding protein 3-like isoform X2 [Microplitis mediator]|uniref:RIMS-binding protein 3-like isoform X2 n=1 Tax=Microplitis mediator TaxID=375433 RepID=UPI002555332C|nr:RIMS-binding protein 3-like isoform X2 [Microplitis mediator]
MSFGTSYTYKMYKCCGVGGGGSTLPQAVQHLGTGAAIAASGRAIMQDPVLESILEQMRETEARRADLERQHADAQNQLREKLAGRYQGPESVEALQSKIRELEKKTELQMVRHEELSLELTSLRRARSRGPGSTATSSITGTTWPPSGSEIDRMIAKIEQDTSGRILHELDHTRGVTTQQPSSGQRILRSSAENLPSLNQQHQHPPHPHALELGDLGVSHYVGSPMPLTPMMPGCPPLTPNGPPYHYSEPIPPAPSSLTTSQSQSAFQQKLQQYHHQHQTHVDMTTSHPQTSLTSQQQQQQQQQKQQAHTHFTSNQYQESYPHTHTQSYQQPLQQQNQQQQQQTHQSQLPVSSTYLGSTSQSVLPHYSQPGGQTGQTFLNGTQQSTNYPNLTLTSHPNGTFTSGVVSSYGTTHQLGHHNYSVPQSNLTQTTLSSLPPYSSSSYHSALSVLPSVSQSVLPYSSVQTSYSTTGSTYSTVGTNAFGTSGVSSGSSSGGLLQAINDPLQAMQQLSAQSQANQLHQQAIINQIQQSLRATSPTATSTTGHHFLGPRQMPKIPTGILTNPLDRLTSENILPEGQVDMLDIPGKGRCYVYIARFSYEPFQHSPNENPEAELPVQGGDYLLVWGQPDDDGFLDAETLDGRRGLVPANFVQKLVGDDLLEFHQAVMGLRDVDDAASTNIPQCYLQDIDLELAALEEGNRNRQAELSAYAELDNIAEEDEQEPPEVYLFSDLVPAPQHLTLERQLNKSVLIGWTPPDNQIQLESYHVYVDGVLKVTVKATERTRALVEGVDSTRPHRISVRSVTHSRRTSRDAACTMVIGKDVAIGPTAVKASNVTATSAVISWLPSNSNHQHVVCVNNVEVRTVKPGVYRHTITGLAPSTIYRVTVKAKNLRATHFEDQNAQSANNLACHVHFKTLSKGLPDPPVDIQVEAGPQDGTLLVTWQPVALNGSAVTGYAVYADGKKVTDVDSPTGDHALVDIHKLMGLNPKAITVRTKSRESQSSDSCATAIPCSVLRGGPHMQSGMDHSGDPQQQGYMGMGGGRIGQRFPGAPVPAHMRRQGVTRVDAHGQVIIETDENLSDKEIYPGQSISQMGIPEITKDSASEANYSEEDDPTRRGRGMQQHPGHHRYGPQGGQQGPPGTHRPVPGRAGRGPDQYYDQQGAQRGRGPVYRGGRGGQVQVGPHHPDAQQNKRPRWFVALYDYDPPTMSPNPDACEIELPFSEGDTIKVYGDKDDDGFYWGECRGRRGFVPHNMVEELKNPPPGAQGPGQPGRRGQNDRWGDIYTNMPVRKMIALYDYDPQVLSPNVDAEQVELRFQTGNEIYVYGDMDDDGFYMGELDGVRGLVPSNFLAEAGPNKGQPPQPGRRPPGQGQGPGARGPPPPPREPPPPGHRRNKDACIVPVSVPVCHLDSRQQQPQQHQQQQLQQQQQHQQQQQQNNPPHLAYQQANHHSYTTVTTSNQHGGQGVGVMAHQQGAVPPHLQQQGRGRGAANRVGGSNMPGGLQQAQQFQQQQDYQQQHQQQQQQQQQQQPNQQGYNQQNPNYQQQQQQPGPQGYQQQNYQQQPQQQGGQQQYQQNQGPSMQGPQSSKPMRGIPAVIPTAQKPLDQQQQQQQQQQPSTGPNLMQKFTEMAGASAGGDILSKGKELIFMKFGLGK